MATTTRAPSLLRSIRTSDAFNARYARFENLYSFRRNQQNDAAFQHARPFSSTISKSMPGHSQIKPKQKPQKSIAVAMEEMKLAGEVPDDVGLLEGTFVQPIYDNRPDWISEPRRRWTWEQKRAWAKFKDLLQREYTRRYMMLTHPPSYYKNMGWMRWLGSWFVDLYDLERSKLVPNAKQLYEEMYTRFANGSIDAMRPRLCDTIYVSLASRIQARAPNTNLEWKLHRYVGTPWLCSYRVGALSDKPVPSDQNNTIQQAVVRIRSMQSLKRSKRIRGKGGAPTTELVEEGSGEEKLVIEYLVIQKMLRKGKPGPWMIWGTTEETTMEKLEAVQKKKMGDDVDEDEK